MFPNTDAVQAALSLERFREALIANPATFGDSSAPISFTGGVATLVDHLDTVDSILARADRALYAAKHEGRNRVIVDASDTEG